MSTPSSSIKSRLHILVMTCHTWISAAHAGVEVPLKNLGAAMKSSREMSRITDLCSRCSDREGASDESSLRCLSTLRARGRSNSETLVPPQLWPPLRSLSSPLLPNNRSPSFSLGSSEAPRFSTSSKHIKGSLRDGTSTWSLECFIGHQTHTLLWFIQGDLWSSEPRTVTPYCTQLQHNTTAQSWQTHTQLHHMLQELLELPPDSDCDSTRSSLTRFKNIP